MKWLRARFLAATLTATTALAATLVPHDAHASVSIAMAFDDLVTRSAAAVIVTPFEQKSVWEGGRIYTYSHVRFDNVIAGNLAGEKDAWVRTEGGIVGDIGQSVDGEAAFSIGKSSLVFLHAGDAGTWLVTGRAQGQFPVKADPATNTTRLMRSATVGVLMPARGAAAGRTLASDVLHGRAVDDAVKEIASAWKRLHAP